LPDRAGSRGVSGGARRLLDVGDPVGDRDGRAATVLAIRTDPGKREGIGVPRVRKESMWPLDRPVAPCCVARPRPGWAYRCSPPATARSRARPRTAPVDGPASVPQDSGPMAMFYRRDLFERWRIDVPTTWGSTPRPPAPYAVPTARR